MKEKLKWLLRKLTLPQDKANHAMYGLVVYSFVALYSPFVAIMVVLVLGIAKEIAVDNHVDGTVDMWDAVATVIVPMMLYGVTLL